MEFECRYTHDLAYNQTLLRQIRRRSMGSTLFWLLFLVFSAGMGLYCFWTSGFVWQCVIYGFLFLLSLFEVASPPIMVRQAWKKNCAKWGRDRFETTVTFGGSVHYLDDTGMEADIPWNRITELERSGAIFILRGEEVVKQRNGRKRLKKTDYLFFPAAGFADGTGAAFLEWLKSEHPKISLTGTSA